MATMKTPLPEVLKDRDRRRLRGILLLGALSALTAPLDSVYFEGLLNQVRRWRPTHS